jgi:hypothetical protein
MKRMFILLTGCCFALMTLAQTDTTGNKNESDTIRVGGMIIIKKGKTNGDEYEEITIHHRKNDYKPSNISTNWFIFDLGFANFKDETDYSKAQSSGFLGAGVGESQFDLRTGKSVNVNIWVFMQKLNLVKHVVNLKYGLGIETNNYRYEETRLTYQKNPTMITLVDSPTHTKNKLSTDYVTLPLMLNFNFTPRREEGFGLSVGVSAGYLYSSRQKFKGGSGDKYKSRGNFDLEPWKISYIAELQFGPVKFYGSYATKSMFDKGLDQTPYNVGIRFSNW